MSAYGAKLGCKTSFPLCMALQRDYSVYSCGSSCYFLINAPSYRRQLGNPNRHALSQRAPRHISDGRLRAFITQVGRRHRSRPSKNVVPTSISHYCWFVKLEISFFSIWVQSFRIPRS